MDKPNRICFLHYRLMVASTSCPKAHCNRSNWSIRNAPDNGHRVCTAVPSRVPGLRCSPLVTGRADANGLLASWPLLNARQQNLSDSSSTARSCVTEWLDADPL